MKKIAFTCILKKFPCNRRDFLPKAKLFPFLAFQISPNLPRVKEFCEVLLVKTKFIQGKKPESRLNCERIIKYEENCTNTDRFPKNYSAIYSYKILFEFEGSTKKSTKIKAELDRLNI